MAVDVKGIAKEVEAASGFVKPFLEEIGRVIVGQEYLIERLMLAMLCGGHALLEGDGRLGARRRVPQDPVHARPPARGPHRHARV